MTCQHIHRRWFLAWLAATGLCFAGCRWLHPDPFAPTATCQMPAELSPQELVQYLNQHGASAMQAWRANNVKISSRGAMAMPVALDAKLAVAAPRNLRLVASSMIGNEVDLGSNDERFWFWVRRTDAPRVVTARHDQAAVAQQRLAIPFQPDWIIEALGVIPFDAKEVRLNTLPTQPGGRRYGQLVCERTTPQGEPVQKVTLVDLCHGIILEHALYDSSQKLIAKAVLSRHHHQPGSTAIIAHRIDLEWPQTRLGLTLDLGPVDLNPQELSPHLFALPNIPNAPVLDIGQGGGPGSPEMADRGLPAEQARYEPGRQRRSPRAPASDVARRNAEMAARTDAPIYAPRTTPVRTAGAARMPRRLPVSLTGDVEDADPLSEPETESASERIALPEREPEFDLAEEMPTLRPQTSGTARLGSDAPRWNNRQ